MAIKMGLVSFEFDKYKDLQYDPEGDRKDYTSGPQKGYVVQPVIEKAFKSIIDLLGKTISPDFNNARRQLINVNDFLHMGTTMWRAELLDYSMASPQMCDMATVKFYKLEPSIKYKVDIDIEEMIDSTLGVDERTIIYKVGFNNDRLVNFAKALDTEFGLDNKLEMIPIFLRGYYEAPRFLRTTDDRSIEFDVENTTLCSIKSDYQEIIVLQSKSLGKMLLLNERPVMCELDKRQVNSMMDKEFSDYDDKRILILGGGDGALLNELLMIERVKFVHLVEIDARVLETSSRFFPRNNINLDKLHGDRYRIIIQDARKFLLNSLKSEMKWDIIFNDMTHEPLGQNRRPNLLPPRSQEDKDLEELIQQTSPWFFFEPFFNLSMKCLQDGGVFIMKLNSVNNDFDKHTFDDFLNNSSFNINISIHKSFVPTLMEVCYFYTITKLSNPDDTNQ